MSTPIQFGHITVAGKTYPVKFGLSQTRIYTTMMDCKIADYNRLILADGEEEKEIIVNDKKEKQKVPTSPLSRMDCSVDEFVAFIYSVLKDGHRVEGKEFTLTTDDVADLMDEFKTETFVDLFKIMNDSANVQEQASPNGTVKATKAKN